MGAHQSLPIDAIWLRDNRRCYSEQGDVYNVNVIVAAKPMHALWLGWVLEQVLYVGSVPDSSLSCARLCSYRLPSLI